MNRKNRNRMLPYFNSSTRAGVVLALTMGIRKLGEVGVHLKEEKGQNFRQISIFFP